MEIEIVVNVGGEALIAILLLLWRRGEIGQVSLAV
jgi:hypothetical protein